MDPVNLLFKPVHKTKKTNGSIKRVRKSQVVSSDNNTQLKAKMVAFQQSPEKKLDLNAENHISIFNLVAQKSDPKIMTKSLGNFKGSSGLDRSQEIEKEVEQRR